MALTGQTVILQKMISSKPGILPLFAAWRTLAVLVTAVLIFVSGCRPAGTGPAKPPYIEPNAIEPSDIEPRAVETKAIEPNIVEVSEPNLVEPNVAEVNLVEPNQVKPPPRISFHDKCAPILTTYVNDKGMVDYRKLNHKEPEFADLLDEFAKLDRKQYNSWPKADKIALWINAWNIQMLKVIIDNYPIEASRINTFFWPPSSIRHIPPTDRVGVSKWDKYKILVMDEAFTLAQIEQRFFREQFDEPRVFFAITHASLSSPPLRNEPYYGYKLSEQLDDQVRKFLASPRAFKIERDRNRVNLSAILQPDWYGREFVSKYGIEKKFKEQPPATRAVLNFITNYVPEQDVLFLERESYSIKYIRYDWRLNDGSTTSNQ